MNNAEQRAAEVLEDKDLYAVIKDFADYGNRLARIRISHDGKVTRTRPMPTLSEHFIGTESYYEAQFKQDQKLYPEKVARIDHVVQILNRTEDATVAKQAINEIDRLIYGKDAELRYPEPEFNPDLLKI